MSAAQDGITTVPDAEGSTVTLVKWDGLYYPPFEGVYQRLENLKNFEARDDDVLLATYPKSGTHWLLSIIHMILRNTTEHADPQEIRKTFLEARDGAATVASPRVINTHVPYRYIPPDIFKKKVKIILLYRNPKDTAVSLFHFYNNTKRYQYKGTWNGFFPCFIKDEVIYGSWYEYTLTWWEKEKSNPNVMFVSYEDLKKDGLIQLKNISKFLGVERSDEFLQKVEQQCSFSAMKEVNSKKSDSITAQHSAYRKGEVGDWKNHFTVAQNEEFDEMHRIKMKDSDIAVKFTI